MTCREPSGWPHTSLMMTSSTTFPMSCWRKSEAWLKSCLLVVHAPLTAVTERSCRPTLSFVSLPSLLAKPSKFLVMVLSLPDVHVGLAVLGHLVAK